MSQQGQPPTYGTSNRVLRQGAGSQPPVLVGIQELNKNSEKEERAGVKE